MDVFMCLVGVILLYVGFVAWVLEGGSLDERGVSGLSFNRRGLRGDHRALLLLGSRRKGR